MHGETPRNRLDSPSLAAQGNVGFGPNGRQGAASRRVRGAPEVGVPQWVLLLCHDSVGAVELEQEIRLAGYSPRRAPDIGRAEVLLGRGEQPAAVVIDLGDATDAGLGAVDTLRARSGELRVVALTPEAEGPLARRADEAGLNVLARSGAARGGLAALLGRLLGSSS